jgi:hypothetical protein
MITSWYIKNGYELTLCYDESVSGGGIYPGQENQSYPDREDENWEITLLSLHRPDSKHLTRNHDDICVGFDPAEVDCVHLVVVTYGDGDTFGNSHGHRHVEGVYRSAEEAIAVAESIRDDTYEGYKAWKSYFGSYEGVDVVSMDIED